MSGADERVRAQLARWRDDLLDLTARNRLLRFRHPRTASLEIESPAAQEVLDRLLTGRSREWTVYVPPDEPSEADVDPTASRVSLGPSDRRGSAAAPVNDVLTRLGAAVAGSEVWVSFGALRWQHDGTHTAALFLVPAQVEHVSGWRLRLSEHVLRVNPAVLAHFDREFGADLGEERYRIESAGIESYLTTLRDALEPLNAKVDDRIGVISAEQYAEMLTGELDITPGVLISEAPREGVLAGLAGAPDEGLPLLPAKTRALGISVPKRRATEPVLRTTKTTARDVRAACAALSRRAASEFMDRGIWVLYLGVGMLHWSDPADGRAETQDSPVLLIPVRLEAGKRGSEWKVLPSEEEALVNPALWLKLETELGIELPDLDPDEPLDVASVLGEVRARVASHADWSVEERVVLSTFSFHKEAMYRDLRDNFEQIAEHPVVRALASDPSDGLTAEFVFDPVDEDRLDDEFPPEQATTILDADASQRQCIAAAREGRSFVMDGPPGTGKSQTIANMIAELLADGKTVLFVSEKAAALDVVHDRLARVGLDEYVLELHSHKTTRAVVATALGGSLLRRPKPRPSLSELELTEAQRRRDALTRYAHALNQPVELLGGRSLHELLGRIAELQHLPQAPVATRAAERAEDLERVREMGATLSAAWEVVERGEDFYWRGAAADRWDAATEQRVQAKLDELDRKREELQAVAEGVGGDLLLEPPTGPAGARALEDVLRIVDRRPRGIEPAWLSQLSTTRLREIAARATQRAEEWQAASAEAVAAAGPRWQEVDEPGVTGTAGILESRGAKVPDDARAADARRLAAVADELAAIADDAHHAASELAAVHGLSSAEITLSHAESAIQLAEVPAQSTPPPSAWLKGDDDALAAARSAVERIAPYAAAHSAAREVASIFEPSVLDLDLEGLSGRFSQEHRGLKKLSGAYRADRDLVAGTAPSAKPKDAVAGIGDALEWQRAREALLGAAERDAAALAEAWTGPDTDIAELKHRVEVAEHAIRIAGNRIVDSARFADAVSGRRRPAEASALADRADRAVAKLRAEAPDALRGALQGPLNAAGDGLREVAAAWLQLADITSRVDALRGSPGTVAEAMAANRAERAAAAAQAGHDADPDVPLLGTWATLELAPGALAQAVSWACELADALPGRPTGAAAQRLVTASPDHDDLQGSLLAWQTVLEAALTEFDTSHRGEVAADLEADFDDAAALIARLRDHRGEIETWIAYASARTALAASGLADAADFCATRRIPVAQVASVLTRSALEATADALLTRYRDELGPLRAVDRDRLVREFASLDRKVVGDATHRVMQAANGRRPNAVLGVAAIIANESQKKRRHMPVSHLLAKTAPVAQAVKPCFMMSPLSVSQFLAPAMHFDVVIFDEASQVRPSDAVNALYRAGAMIVAGDQKQLPPTSFFEQSADDGEEWTEDSLAEFDSVLDLAKGSGAFRSLSLRWHYRSRHEHLIAFSNHRFYGGDLVTFPSPAETADALGVQLIPVDGVYRRGTTRDNPIEAQAIADRVFAHADGGRRSIGVVAFSEAQASLIEEVLRQDPRREDSRFAELFSDNRLAGLFVKNLENVQGDERDVVIFSIGYGPDEHGKLTMNFGPMNREGGWRRLNVAITRARQRVEVVCSFSPDRLAPGSRTRGVDELRRYLEFAATGPAVLARDSGLDPGGEPESPFEHAVLRTLRSWGHDVVPQVGTAGYRIDMAVRHPDRAGHFALGIECDGAMYHSSRVARDRDRLREQVLAGLGWTLHRIWGPSWYRDRSGEERRLREALDRAFLQTSAARPSAPTTPIAVDFEDLVLDAPPAWAEPYVPAVLPLPQSVEPYDPSATAEVRTLILQTVAEEAPIVEDLLARRIVDSWKLMLSEKRRAAVRRSLERLAEAGTLVRHGNAYCLPNQRIDLVRVPQDGMESSEREVKHVPDVELAEAVFRLVMDARMATEEEVQQRAARLFGWRRTGPAIQAALARTIEHLVDEARVQRSDGHLRAVNVRPIDEPA